MVIDTMVFVYALLGVPPFHHEATDVLKKVSEIWVPDSIHAELANVVWQWVTHRNVSRTQAQQVLEDANGLIDEVTPTDTLWLTALDLAIRENHAAYDTIFVSLAIEKNCKVITYDKKLLKKFPNETMTPADFLK
jgi:predicted nucleic acid-binding protein